MTDKVNFLQADWLVEYRSDLKFNSHSRAKYEPFHYRGGHTGQDGVMVLYINVAGGNESYKPSCLTTALENRPRQL